MSDKISLIIGTILVFSAIQGFTIYNDHLIKESKTGPIIEKTIEAQDFNDVFIPAKSK